jgi:hypothetical protein
MGHILEKIKKNHFFAFLCGFIQKAKVWVIFWRKFKKDFFDVSEWTYTMRL